jgi:gliding motility-associated-like protein
MLSTFYLITKKGIDGDVARDFCEKEFREQDTLRIVVDSCYKYTTPPNLINVSVNENTSIDITWEDPNPAVDTTFFESYEIYKNVGSGAATSQFPVTRIFDYSIRSWNDVDVTPTDDSYNYALAIKLKPLGANFVTGKSDSISSIHLQVDPPADPDDKELNLTWTPYWGWLNELYRIEMRTANNWVQVDSTFGTSLVYTKPTEPGQYTLRIRTTVQTPVELTSLSNWITFGVPEIIIPIKPIRVPNVFTPNGDGINDLFFVENLEDYPNTYLQVFNRWGTLVYSTNNYNNNWNGDGNSPGIYYYFLKLENGEEFKGALRLIR